MNEELEKLEKLEKSKLEDLKKKTPKEKLQSLLLASFKARRHDGVKSRRELRELGLKLRENVPEFIKVENNFLVQISDLLASRLKQPQRSAFLFSPFELVDIIDKIIKIEGIENEKHETFKNELFLEYKGLLAGNFYKNYWGGWIATVCDLAAKHSISPTELMALESTQDKIMRRLFSKKKFATCLESQMFAFLETLRSTENIANTIKNEGEYWRNPDCLPEIRESRAEEKFKKIYRLWINEQIKRIYDDEK